MGQKQKQKNSASKKSALSRVSSDLLATDYSRTSGHLGSRNISKKCSTKVLSGGGGGNSSISRRTFLVRFPKVPNALQTSMPSTSTTNKKNALPDGASELQSRSPQTVKERIITKTTRGDKLFIPEYDQAAEYCIRTVGGGAPDQGATGMRFCHSGGHFLFMAKPENGGMK